MLAVMTTTIVSRQCHMSPGGVTQWLRTTVLEEDGILAVYSKDRYLALDQLPWKQADFIVS